MSQWPLDTPSSLKKPDVTILNLAKKWSPVHLSVIVFHPIDLGYLGIYKLEENTFPAFVYQLINHIREDSSETLLFIFSL
jgi:hypothetical protein